MKDTERERERDRERGRDAGRGRNRLHAGSPTWTRSRDSRITPRAEGRGQTTEPPRDSLFSKFQSLFLKAFLKFAFRHAVPSVRDSFLHSPPV